MLYQDERTYGCRISDAWTYRGLKTVVMENETLRVSILADKGADIFELVHKPSDTDFAWRTPWSVRDVTRWTPSTGDGPAVFHEVYIGGWNTIAPTGGPPQVYAGVQIGQHTEANLMPWDALITEDTAERVTATLRCRTVRAPFFIEKSVTLESGSNVLSITESLTNEAEEEAEAQWGQHVALGEPFLTPRCRLDLPGAKFFAPGDRSPSRIKPGSTGEWPMAEDEDGTPVDLRAFPAKSDRLHDYMVFKDLKEGWYAVTNPDRGIGIGVVFPTETFKYLWYWQVFGGGKGFPWYGRTYNVGLEPFSSLGAGQPEPGSTQRTSMRFAPGEKRTATVRAVVYKSTNGVTSISPDGLVQVR